MKVIALTILTMLMCMAVTVAQVINSEFKLQNNITNLKEGDFFEATIRIWPIENADIEFFKSFDKTILFNAFYLAEINSLKISPNNADVVELKATYLVQSAKPQPIHSFNYKGLLIEIPLGRVVVKELLGKTSEFIILDQELPKKTIWKIVFVVFGLFLALVLIKRKKLKEIFTRIRKREEKKNKERFRQLFDAAETRIDYELIYKEKEIWQKYLEVLTPSHREFFKVMDKHQYKRFWSNEDSDEIKSSFDTIRRSFNK